MTPAWVDLPALAPSLAHNASQYNDNAKALRGTPVGGELENDLTVQEDAARLRGHQADLLLLSFVLLFLVGSHVVCRCCRCRWLYRHRHARDLSKTPGSRSYAYTLYQSNASSTNSSNSSGAAPHRVVMESVTASSSRTEHTPPTRAKSVLVSDMEQPFLGPPDYAQPPPYEMSPPAYEYLPSAPPLSDDAGHSPRQM